MTAEICPEGMVCIGTGTSTSNYMPLNNYYNYSLTEQIYTADEIGEAGAILSIDFYKAATVGAVKVLDIYIVSTTKDEFTSTSDWIPVTASDLVYSGTVTFADNAWTTIELDSPFIYDGVSNICIVVDNNTGSFVSSTAFRVFNASNNQTLYYQSDSNNLDPTAISQSAYGETAQKNRIRLNIGEPPACPKPTGVTASDVTAHEATITWTSDASAWQIQLGEENAINVTEPTYTFTGLAPETPYSVKVRANCDGTYSEWANGSFTTAIACTAPTGLAAALTLGNGSIATLSWTNDANAWVVAYKTAEEEEFTEVNVDENPYMLTGLTPETAYTAKVKAVCGGEDGESDWSSSITFTPTNAYMLTVNDGTTTNGNVPVYGYYVDNYSYSQFIIPATNLTAMEWGTINELTFYSSSATVAWTGAKFEVYMTETTETTLSALADWTTMDKVMNEAHLEISGNQMVVTLDAPYQYLGGNLMVGIKQTVSGTYGSAYFYGITATGASMGGYGSSYGSSISQKNFLPKTTFAYEPGEAPTCIKPTGVNASEVTAHGATISWTSDASAWEIQLNEEEVITVTEPTYTFTGLAPETTYSVKVRTNCDGDYSDWTTAVNFTTGIACPVPTVAVSNITAYTAEVNCTNTDAEYFNVMLGENVVAENVTMPYTLTDLTDNTSYTVKVKAICGGEDGESQWSNGTSFMTAEICPEGMVCIGTGTNTNQFVPTYTYYNYSLTQQIYTAAEIGQSGEITSVDFYKSGTNGGTRTLDIYMVSTDKETFSGATDWIAVTASDLVYSGSVTFQNDAWTTIEFNTPFLYDGTTNIALIVDDNTGSYVFSAPSFYAFNATSQAIRIYSDDTNYDATAPSSYSGTVLTQKNRIRIAIGEPPACPKPTGLAVNYAGGITATVTWEGDATSYNIDVNGTVTEGVTSPYTLEGLELATTYAVMVQANCGEDLSEWTSAVSFTTDLCMPENQCEITFELTDSFGDGWNGAYIEVVDVTTETVLGQFTNTSEAEGGEAQIYTLAVCNGRAIQFVWHSGSYDYEASYVVTDLNGEEIFSGSGVMSAPINYTVNCTVITCKKPKDLAAFDINKTSVVLSWTPGTEDQTAWRICYNDGEEDHFKNVTTIPYTLNGLTPETEYTVKVRANCGGGDYSNWSDEISFTTAEACPADIYDFSAYNITVHNALLSWSGEFNSYQVRYKKWTGETEWSDAIPTNEAAIALSGLEAGTVYVYQVQGYCSDVDAYSEWADGSYFTTQSICSAPQNLYAVPGINSATISWTGYQESYTVACGDAVKTVYGTTYTLEGLESSTEYTVTVTGVGTECGEYQSATLEFATGAGWDDPNAWAEPGVLNDSTVVVIQPGGEGPTEIPENITVGDGSYIVIEPGAEVIYGGGDPIPVVLGSDDDDDDGDGMGSRCRDELPGGYRLIAPPVFNSLTEPFVSVVSTHLMDLPDDYFVNDLYSFNVNYPAQEWRNYKELANNFVNFNWKQGYLFYGYYTKVNWQGHIVANTNNSVEIALDYNEAHTYFPGANLIGNPFWAKGYPDMEFYVLNTDGNEVVAATNNYVGKAKGFFVLAEGPNDTCTVYTEAPNTCRSLNIALSQDCSLIDAAAIRFNDTKGLAKIQLNPNHTKIYMPFEGKDYAILQGEGLGEMPLNFEAEENGTYTLSFTSKEVNFSYLHLIDNLTGVETNLLANPSYSFEAKTTDYASRFRLVYATGSSVNGDNFGFINSMGNLSIYGIEGVATLQVMDVTGRILSTETFSGSYERKLNVAPGVYMLRLINGNDVKVQKMVIR